VRRREFITLVGGAAAAWPLVARAQQGERMRLIAVLMSVDNPEARANYAAFVQSLKQLGWVDGQNVRIEARWADGTASLIRKNATELLALAPDVVVVSGNNSMGALLQATLPIVFAQVADPVGSGFVKTMARPGGNATGLFSSTTV
jgi:putative ABC transport system substrate-binding protein